MLGRTDSRRRLLFLLGLFLIGTIALVARTAYWQVVRSDWLMVRAVAQTTVSNEIPSRRGDIFDRSGVVLLATTVDRERLYASADQIPVDRIESTGDALVKLLELDAEAEATVRARLDSGDPYVILARGIEPRLAERIRQAARDGRIVGIGLEPEPERVYPQAGGGPDSSLAAHLLGFVNRESQGQYGVESYYQDILAGQPRVSVSQRDVSGRIRPETTEVTQPGVAGEDLTLTIDAGLQLAVEQELLAAYIADEAKSVSAVVMDPYTGEIYAEASYPSYDANDYRTVASSDPARFVDPVVAHVYEPGSVFKMMTAAVALERGTVTRTTKLKDTGKLKLDNGKSRVENADGKGMGWITFEDGIAYSRNVIAAKVARELGDSTRSSSAILFDEWLKLGYGSPTGVDIAGEASGLLRDPAVVPWAEIDLANGSFGQGVAVTPIQLAAAYAALLNGGTMVQPHVVKSIGTQDQVIGTKGRVTSPAISADLRKMADHVVEEVPFYRDRTLVPGYHVGGKTGTAQIWDAEEGRWKDNLFNYSFAGYIAREEGVPDLIVVVRIEEGTPTVARVGHLEMPVMSFELFRRIATDAITTPDLLKDRPMPFLGERDR